MLKNRYALDIARRYLAPSRRNRFVNFITAIAIIGVMFGTAALLISLSILDGFDQTLRSTMVAFMGHIEVTTHGNESVPGYERVVADLPKRFPEIRAVSPFVSREAILRSRFGIEGVIIKGVIAKYDVSQIGQRIVQGKGSFSFDAPGDGLPRIVVGQRLADRLRIGIGDTIVVFGPNGVPTPDNPPTIEQFVLGGIYRSGMAEYDDIYTYASLDVVQRLFQFAPTHVSGYDIALYDGDLAERTARKLDTGLGYPHYPKTVYDIFQPIFAWLDLQRKPIPIVLGAISVVAAFNIIATLLMVVMEKTESIGVLSTLGARPRGIMNIFVSQGLLIGGVGTLLGSLLSLAFTFIQATYKPFALKADIYFVDAVPVAFSIWHYVVVISFTLILCVLSTTIPAYVASRLRPVEALRFR